MDKIKAILQKAFTFLKSFCNTLKGKFSVIRPAAALFIICLFSATALAITNAVTSDIIKAAEEKNLKATLNRTIEAAQYEQETITYGGQSYNYYIAIDENNTKAGYLFNLKSKGYGGDVALIVGINIDGSIKAVEILDATSETAGLGQRITEKSFLDQFVGLKAPFSFNADGSEITVVSGATYSSKAVLSAINTATELFNQINGGAQ